MRKIKTTEIEKTVEALCLEANTNLRKDVLMAIEKLYDQEAEENSSKEMLKILISNAEIARTKRIPICQDTGMVEVFVELGQEVELEGRNIVECINEGVQTAYVKYNFRKSVVDDPINRTNTGTNTPAIVHVDIVEGRCGNYFSYAKRFW